MSPCYTHETYNLPLDLGVLSEKRWCSRYSNQVAGSSTDESCFGFRKAEEISFFFKISHSTFGPTHSQNQCVTGAMFLGLKRPEWEAVHSSPSSVLVRMHAVIISPPPRTLMTNTKERFTFQLFNSQIR
jgi:hypothetical protein